ncbi:hypothetical protein GCM10018793_28370 [Streptomyces sulfonofaciens]|uniref:ABC transmembrane type-1 domain-containing protein n=1 Tax=Streptomyces sulfonofaciens TaxID=68272 RepID=A0A919G5G7_9ACTN|nr:hypothetical protein GCM10018793_28370 [Streptomyces sulfonofaciens]
MTPRPRGALNARPATGRPGRVPRYTPAVRYVLRAAALAAALGAWQLLTSLRVDAWLRFSQFPTVVDVARAFGARLGSGAYWQDLTDSLTRIVTGFLLAAVLGVLAGTAVARSRLAEDLLGPVLEVVRPVPAIALVPVAILLFPSNEQGIVFITCAAAFFPVLVSTRHAVRALHPVWEEGVRTMGGGRRRILRSVVLPGALPGIFGGLSVGIGVSWICVISAEMISGQYGIGYRTWQDYTVVDYPGVFVGMVTIGVLGWLTSTAVELVGRRVTAWLPRRTLDARGGPAPGRTPRGATAADRATGAPADASSETTADRTSTTDDPGAGPHPDRGTGTIAPPAPAATKPHEPQGTQEAQLSQQSRQPQEPREPQAQEVSHDHLV